MKPARNADDRGQSLPLSTLLAWVAAAFLMVRQISNGFSSEWFSVVVVIAFVVTSALLFRELAAGRSGPPRSR